jgi:signal recognition particle subunit SRP19
VQRTKPDLVPREPYTYAHEASTALVVAPKDKSDKGKGKGPARAPAPAPAKPAAPAASVAERPNGRVPLPPSPAPPLPQRVSQYSPAIETGTLVETIKAGLTAQESAAAAAAPGTPGAQVPGGAAKGKKKVIRVRA